LPNINKNKNSWRMHISNIHTNIQQNKRLLTQELWEELAGQMMYPIYKIHTLSLKNVYVQQPVILPNINQNQNPWNMHIFNIHTNIQLNKRLFTLKTIGGVSRTNKNRICTCNIYYQIKGQTSSKRGQNG
jgi:hypothetical protein